MKAKRVQHHKSGFTRNVKGTSLNGKEKTTTRKMKIIRGKKNLIGKSKCKGSRSNTYKASRKLKRQK